MTKTTVGMSLGTDAAVGSNGFLASGLKGRVIDPDAGKDVPQSGVKTGTEKVSALYVVPLPTQRIVKGYFKNPKATRRSHFVKILVESPESTPTRHLWRLESAASAGIRKLHFHKYMWTSFSPLIATLRHWKRRSVKLSTRRFQDRSICALVSGL
ncbi:hypothetical protein K437DRAFT_118623 [Tilletiaria anomala UBC 951]|uniref:Uncharacterized protein n=1 Tax=Tilletiaria anomala (strain ATCC 24038 / CBS 436.72 / UBC 951) TaxID=1037660 RepID=A0A066VZM0_TILAU|nr:uncharacterized protein K437DRAFT_118623 [Tilletiaria anomala UBC 951]KDN45738.1 hypothetical protein K437DRAFT_118623 [Tilletiaria anomala UBC 951]